MARLSKQRLLDQILGAIRAAGWNVVFLSSGHPYDLTIFRNEQSYRTRLYIWNVTHGGGRARPAGEYRIQITGIGDPPIITAPRGFQTLLFGWYDDLEVIAAFDPERHRRPSPQSPSIQISLETLRAGARRGLAVQQRGNAEIALAFRPEVLIAYIENQRALHAFAGEQRDLDLLVQAGTGEEPRDEDLRNVPPERRRVIRQVAIAARDRKFRDRVLAAYGHACAMCHLQLNLVEGAHIVPVGVPGSTDETKNGLALCPLHHDAYDDGLVGVRQDYRIILNDRRIRKLRAEDRGGEETRFRDELQTRIIIPVAVADRPHAEYLRRGLQIRGWAIA